MEVIESIIFTALILTMALFTGMYCLAQDVKHAIRDGAKQIADAIAAAQTSDHTDHTDRIDHNAIGTNLRACGYYHKDAEYYGDPDNNS